MSLYKHRPMLDASRSIRLFTLFPDAFAAPIRCELREVSFPPPQPYTALSYVWGPPPPTSRISIDGEDLHIRQNLESFLLQLRSSLRNDQTLTLWADAICIDQSSTPEKNLQVCMMGQIYSHASNVCAWLGKNVQIERLFQYMEDYCTATTTCASVDQDLVINHRRDRNRSIQAFEEYLEYSSDLLTFYDTEYFHRAWIVQEVILAPVLSIQCGAARLTHDGLRTLFHLLRFQRVMTGRNKVDYILGHYLDSKHDGYRGDDQSFTLDSLMQDYAYTDCSDPHDKVYAFVGTARNLRKDYIVDYDQSLHGLLIDTILYDVRNSNGENVGGLSDYFGITYMLFSSILRSAKLHNPVDFAPRATWAASFGAICRQTLPLVILDRRLRMKVSVMARVDSADGRLVSLDYTNGLEPRYKGDTFPPCRIISGEPVLRGDIVCQMESLSFIYRWDAPCAKLVAMGVTPTSMFLQESVSAWEHIQGTYIQSCSFDSEPNIKISNDKSDDKPDDKAVLSAFVDWDVYRKSTNTGDLTISLPISNFLTVLEADFPSFLHRGGAAAWA